MQIRPSRVREMSEQLSFILLLCSTLLTLIKIPKINIGVHNILLPFISLLIIGLRINVMREVFARYRSAIIFMGLLYLWMWISAFQSEFQNTAIKYSIKYAYYFMLFTALLFLTYKNKNNIGFDRLIILFLLLLSMFGIVEEFYPEISIFHLIRPFGSYMPRVSSLMQNPNPFGSLMSLGVIYSILLRKDETINGAEFTISIILFIICAFLSGSRNAVFVLLMGFIFLAAHQELKFTKRALKWLIPIAVALVFCIFFLSIYYGDQVNYLASHYLHGEGSRRILIWKRALYEIVHHPISGIGIEVFSKHIGIEISGTDIYHTHNILLNILVELGIVGLILSLLFVYNLLKGLNFKDAKIAVPITMILVSQIFDYYSHDVTYAAISLYFLALAANSKNEHFQKPYLAT